MPTPVALLSQLRICIQSVSCGQAHNIALTALGTILVWGSNTHGQLGCGPQTTWTGRPITLDTNVKFICVSAGKFKALPNIYLQFSDFIIVGNYNVFTYYLMQVDIIQLQ